MTCYFIKTYNKELVATATLYVLAKKAAQEFVEETGKHAYIYDVKGKLIAIYHPNNFF